MNITIRNLESIVRDGDNFFARYVWEEEVEINVSLPTFTGIGMNGKQNKSRTFKATTTTTRVKKREVKVELEKDDATTLFFAAMDTGMVSNFERLGDTKWVARIGQ